MRFILTLGVVLLSCGIASANSVPPAAAPSGIVVHEWGTFTSLQDELGRAIGGINTDDEPVRQELLELHLQLEEGQIGEEEFAEREAVLFARLREIREYRKEQQSGDFAPRPPDDEQRTVVIEIPEELE